MSAEKLRVLIREEIAEAGVDLLRRDFDVDVDGDSELADVIGNYDGSSSVPRRSSLRS